MSLLHDTKLLWERQAAGYDSVYDDPGRRGRLVRARLATTLALLPDRWRRLRIGGGLAMLAFQVSLIASGNLSFLNWLTIIPALACFDDGFWARILPKRLVRRAEDAEIRSRESVPMLIG